MIGRTQGRFRTRPKLINTFSVALMLSLLFHLSMLTIFNVVAIFPVPNIDFYSIDIVQSAMRPTEAIPPNLVLKGINLGDAKLGISASGAGMELPTVEFAELERLRVGQPKVDVETLYNSLYPDFPSDSWGRFSGGLQKLGESIRDISLDAMLGVNDEATKETQPTFRPTEGFVGYITWNDTTKARKLLFTPPIKALWNLEPSTLSEPIELVFEVNADGRIVNVYSASVENQELLDAVQLGVLQYRFDPLSGESMANQLGTLRIQADRRVQ